MRWTLILITVVMQAYVAAQGYIPTLAEGNHWEIRRDLGLGTYVQWDYELVCDTVVSTKTYFVIREMRTDTIMGFVREDTLTQEIYFLGKGSIEEDLIISYDLHSGDTITILGQLLGVDTVVEEFIFGAERKVIQFNPLFRFIEGIGHSWLGILKEVFPGNGGPFQYVNDIYPTIAHCETTAVDEILMNDIIQLYPNPFDDHITVKTVGTRSESFCIYTITGQHIGQYATTSSIDIDTEEFAPGIYLIRSDSGKMKKMIKY